MDEFSLLQKISIVLLPILFAITVHEVAHGWMAKRLGDPTAERLGRLTLNPIKHIDPFGTVLVPGLLLLIGAPFLFGWAKPVPVTWENLRNPRRDMALVAAAGPGANLLMAFGWAALAKLATLVPASAGWFAQPLFLMGMAGVTINLVFTVLNLLPIPPLDGGRVAVGLLPEPWAWRLSQVEPYGFFILIFLLVSRVLHYLLLPPLLLLQAAVLFLVGLS